MLGTRSTNRNFEGFARSAEAANLDAGDFRKQIVEPDAFEQTDARINACRGRAGEDIHSRVRIADHKHLFRQAYPVLGGSRRRS